MKILGLMAAVAVLAMAGCSTVVQPESMVEYQRRQDASLRHQVEDMQALIDKRRQRLAVSTDRAEQEALRTDLSDMGQQITQLQQQMSDEGRYTTTTPQGSTPYVSKPTGYSGGNMYIGPRGGCYKLTRSGKKNYGAC